MNKLLVNTPQNVKFSYNLAPVGARIIAFAIDYGMIITYMFLVFFILNESRVLQGLDDWSAFGLYSVLSIPAIFYPLILETLMSGQTIGKMAMKLKVVKVDGTRATFYQYFIRWISNTVDIMISMGGIGMLFIILTKKSQRIGDLAADTTVISLKENMMLTQTLFREITKEHSITYPEVIKLSDIEMNEINDIYRIAHQRKNYQIVTALAEKVVTMIGSKPQGKNADEFLSTVIADHYYLYREK